MMNFVQTFFRNNWKKLAIMIVVDLVMYYGMNKRHKRNSFLDGIDELW